MGARRVFWGALLVFALVLMVGGITLAAQLADGVDRWVVAGGGGTSGGSSAGGTYSLSGSAGQAGTGTMTGGTYALQSGFWRRAAAGPTPPPTGQNGNSLYLPLIVGD